MRKNNKNKVRKAKSKAHKNSCRQQKMLNHPAEEEITFGER